MKVLAINGSPRKKWNTVMLLNKALKGATLEGAETELIHLYDFNFKGCISCFACKIRNGKSYGKCVVRDEVTSLYEKITESDAILLGSPIYLGTVTGEMRSFLERLIFPYFSYTDPPQSLFPKKINVGFIYTMGVTQKQFEEFAYAQHLGYTEMILNLVFGSLEKIYSYDTYQFSDYSKVVADRFDVQAKEKRRQEIFPQDCQKASEMGMRFAKGIFSEQDVPELSIE